MVAGGRLKSDGIPTLSVRIESRPSAGWRQSAGAAGTAPADVVRAWPRAKERLDGSAGAGAGAAPTDHTGGGGGSAPAAASPTPVAAGTTELSAEVEATFAILG